MWWIPLACVRGRKVQDVPPPVAVEPQTDPLQMSDLSLQLPMGWSVVEAAEGVDRVRLRHDGLGLEAMIRVFPAPHPEPESKSGCVWTFQDEGRYRLVPRASAYGVATCTPLAGEGGHWFSTILDGARLHVEVWIPDAALAQGWEHLPPLLRGVTLND